MTVSEDDRRHRRSVLGDASNVTLNSTSRKKRDDTLFTMQLYTPNSIFSWNQNTFGRKDVYSQTNTLRHPSGQWVAVQVQLWATNCGERFGLVSNTWCRAKPVTNNNFNSVQLRMDDAPLVVSLADKFKADTGGNYMVSKNKIRVFLIFAAFW